nr:MAG TPA: hypothetical protein [Caudoviricetes sp.]
MNRNKFWNVLEHFWHISNTKIMLYLNHCSDR